MNNKQSYQGSSNKKDSSQQNSSIKFKKKSDFKDSQLPSNLERKSRISINVKTGLYEFRYGGV